MNLIPGYFFIDPDRIRLIAVRVVSSRKSTVNDGMPGTPGPGSSPGCTKTTVSRSCRNRSNGSNASSPR
jgi:hypothetical protein